MWQKSKQDLWSLFFNTWSPQTRLECPFGECIANLLSWFVMKSTMCLLWLLSKLELLLHFSIFGALRFGNLSYYTTYLMGNSNAFCKFLNFILVKYLLYALYPFFFLIFGWGRHPIDCMFSYIQIEKMLLYRPLAGGS